MTPAEFKQIRQAMGVTQAQLAKISGIQQSNISMYENGGRDIPRYIARLMIYLDWYGQINDKRDGGMRDGNKAQAHRKCPKKS